MVKQSIFFLLLFVDFMYSQDRSTLPKQDLYLEAYLDAEDEWYPGQEGTVVYKIWYKGEILLTKESLPLLDIPGLEKVGDKVFYEYHQGPFSIQEINQTYKSKQAGTFSAPASIIEGVHYKIENGEKKLLPPRIITETPSYSITIADFPEEGRPNDFSGSIGSGTFELTPPSSVDTRVGDWIPLTISAKGFSEKSVLVFPNLDCLPGFAGFFKMDHTYLDINQSSPFAPKTFSFRLLAENGLPTEIPPILWSVFDPKTKSYQTWQSDPIPILISEVIGEPPNFNIGLEELKKRSYRVDPIPDLPYYHPHFKWQELFESFWLWTHLFILGCIACYFLLRKPLKFLIRKYRQNPLRNALILENQDKNPDETAKIFEKLLKDKLVKKGYMKRGKLVSEEEKAKETFNFIQLLEQFRFAKGGQLNREMILSQGKKLYRALLIFFLISPLTLQGEINSHLEKGNQAHTWIEREREWNLALEELLKEKESKSSLLTIAFLLEEMNQLPEALYTLEKADLLYPDASTSDKIIQLQNKLGVESTNIRWLVKIPSHVFKLISLVLILAACFIYFSKGGKTYSIALLVSSYVLVAMILFAHYYTPKNGIALHPTFIFKTSGQKVFASNTPLIPGQRVQIVGVNGDLFNIYVPEQQIYGSVPQKDIIPINE